MIEHFLKLKTRMMDYSNCDNRVDLILKEFVFMAKNIDFIDDEEFWLLLDIFDTFPEISEFGIGGFIFELLIDAPGWPYNDQLLLRSTKELSVMFVKDMALDAGAKVFNTKCLPEGFHLNKDIEKYWEKIDWNKVTLEERKLILSIIGGSDPFSESLRIKSESINTLVDGIPESEFWLYSFDPSERLTII